MSALELQTKLDEVASRFTPNNTSKPYAEIESLAQSIADILRVQDTPEDNHTVLGKTPLPQTITSLLTNLSSNAPVPADEQAPAVLQLLRVGANLCLDHDENRGYLLDAGFPQAVMGLLEEYTSNIQLGSILNVGLVHLKVARTAIGVLLNASLGFDPVKVQLNAQDAGMTILRLATAVYPPGTWVNVVNDGSSEEWATRQGLSSWAWRLVSELKEVNDDTVQILGASALPLFIPYFKLYIPPFQFPSDSSNNDLGTFVQSDFDLLEESSTLIESLALDVDEVRTSLARGLSSPNEHQGVPCLSILLDFVQHGEYHPLWSSTDSRRRKSLDTCKAAVIKVIVEVAGEEGNADVLWDSSNSGHPGGPFVHRMAGWLKSYVDAASSGLADPARSRDDLAICASLSLGNLARQEQHAVASLSPPYSLAELLASRPLLSPDTDIRLKHGVLGLLRHLAQAATRSQIVQQHLTSAGLVTKIAASGIWDQKADAMAEVVQVSAIGVVKFLCNANIENTFNTILPMAEAEGGMSPLRRILSLVKRSESVHVKSEGTRVLVNAIRSLWSNEDAPASPVVSPIINSVNMDNLFEKGKKRQDCIKLVMTQECASALASLLARSGKFPSLVNEAIVALSLLASQRMGAPLVLKAVAASPEHDAASAAVPNTQPSASNSISSKASSPVLTTPNQNRIPLPPQPLDMLVTVLEDPGTPVNYPIEVRLNACSLLGQIGKNTRDAADIQEIGEKLTRLRETVRPVLERISTAGGDGKQGLLAASARKALQLVSV